MKIKIFFICLFTTACITLLAQNNVTTLNVASYNIRMDTPRDSLDAWEHRKENVNGLIRFHDFDIFGIQEGFIHQITDILKPGGYSYVGAGRDDGKDAGEHS